MRERIHFIYILIVHGAVAVDLQFKNGSKITARYQSMRDFLKTDGGIIKGFQYVSCVRTSSDIKHILISDDLAYFEASEVTKSLRSAA